MCGFKQGLSFYNICKVGETSILSTATTTVNVEACEHSLTTEGMYRHICVLSIKILCCEFADTIVSD